MLKVTGRISDGVWLKKRIKLIIQITQDNLIVECLMR